MSRLILTDVQHDQRVRVEDHHVSHALRQIELRRDFEVFRLVTFADDFDHRFRNELDRFLFLVRLATKDGNVRALQLAVWKTNVHVGGMDAPAFAIFRFRRWRDTFDCGADAVNGLLVFIDRLRFTNRQPSDNF